MLTQADIHVHVQINMVVCLARDSIKHGINIFACCIRPMLCPQRQQQTGNNHGHIAAVH